MHTKGFEVVEIQSLNNSCQDHGSHYSRTPESENRLLLEWLELRDIMDRYIKCFHVCVST